MSPQQWAIFTMFLVLAISGIGVALINRISFPKDKF